MALTRLIGGLKPEEKVAIVVWRDARMVTLSTRLEKRSDDRITELGRLHGESPGRVKDKLGLVLGDVTPEVQKQLNLDESAGVLVLDIEPQGSAARSKLQKLDVIRQVGGTDVKNIGEYLAALEKVKHGQSVLMLVMRNSRPLYVAVDIE